MTKLTVAAVLVLNMLTTRMWRFRVWGLPVGDVLKTIVFASFFALGIAAGAAVMLLAYPQAARSCDTTVRR